MMPQERMTSEQFRREQSGGREHKYGAKSCVVDGIQFPSRKEANRYAELKILQRGGVIKDLDVDAHAPIVLEIVVNGMHVTNYRPDFRYWHVEQNRMIWEDTKGFRTDVYRLKKKLVRAALGIEITET